MCGICGYVSFRSTPLGADAPARVESMLGALAHRGPDASALHATAAAVLGATRLAIRGVADGRQPLVDEASGVVAVCNGEIDNHRELKAWLAERGRPVAQATDVAVIPGLYLELGEAFAEHLVGAFAIGLWDPARRRLVLIRDRAGEKPLFFRAAARGAAAEALFATELSALASSASQRAPLAIDRDAVAHYLRFGAFAVPRTPFVGVDKVGPGQVVVIDDTGVHRRRYWRWRTPSTTAPLPSAAGAGTAAAGKPRADAEPAIAAAGKPQSDADPGTAAAGKPQTAAGQTTAAGAIAVGARSDAAPARVSSPAQSFSVRAALEEFDVIFRRAVARQTDVEVPCGVFLSGGVDSSLVTAVARAVRPAAELRAFSLRFGESSYDEGDVAAKVAARLGLTTTEVWVRPEDFMSTLPELVRMAGEPLADPAWVPAALLARRAAADVRQVLVGEGGDELFGGYPTHSGVWLGERYGRLPRPVRRLLAGFVANLPPSDKKVTLSFLLKRFVAGDGLEGLARHLLWTSNIAPDTLALLGVPSGSTTSKASKSGTASGFPGPPAPPGSVLDRVQQHDLETSLAEGLLTKADRASMHFALELRAPFLDRDVMELAATLPERQRVRGLQTKVFLKRYSLRYLPRWVVFRRKRGLSVPLASWLRGPLRGWAEERLSAGRLGAVGIDEAAAGALLSEHLRRERDHARALWTLVVLAEWLDWVAGLAIPAAPVASSRSTVLPVPSDSAAAEAPLAPALVLEAARS